MVPFIPRDCWLSLVLPVRGRFPAVRIFRRSRANIWTFPTLKIGPLQAISRFSQKPCSWSSVAPDLTKFRSTFRANCRANQSAPSRSALFVFPDLCRRGDVFLRGGVCLVATALFLAMASLVWIQPHLFLDGKQLFVICIFL